MSSVELTCRICGCSKLTVSRKLNAPYLRKVWFTLYSCANCKIGFLDPQPSEEFLEEQIYNSEYPLYDFEWVGSSNNSLAKRIYRAAFPHPLLRLLPSKSGTALDVGCGSGYWMHRLRERGWRVTGMDIDCGTISKLESLGFEAVCGSVEKTELGRGRYDLVLLSAVLEHLHDPELALRKARDALKETGVVLIDVPNFGSIEVGLFGDDWSMFSIGHLFYFNQDSLSYLLRKVGFQPEVFVAKSAELTSGYSLARKLSISGTRAAMIGVPLQLLANRLNLAGEFFCRARKI